MAEEFEKLHPILNEITRTVTQLYERQKDVDTLEKLIKLEAILKVKLEEIQAVRAKVENE
ncbi:hypothetical protein HCH_01300 [Hahella chejuensis KCTC 2396]|uniref:Uncharacterized protein n=1 Tax=Hahella chejuensis (strain KCTC 2396) TaxID=349521 RepID=Q2SMF7_HAHCH|nr:hypothetical protein [Hahella chejuensis]ABC28167.1 hypothetical protein HCH_01300 [Hahella chejuensis KCTC 2396]